MEQHEHCRSAVILYSPEPFLTQEHNRFPKLVILHDGSKFIKAAFLLRAGIDTQDGFIRQAASGYISGKSIVPVRLIHEENGYLLIAAAVRP